MSLRYYDFKRNEELMSDELIQNAVKLLEKRFNKMSNWIKYNTDMEKCPECDSKDLEYFHNGIKCKDCNHFIDVEVPFPVHGGIISSRKLESAIKELFASKMGQKRRKEKPNEDDLRELPYKLDGFDTGEYTESETEYLDQRYNELMQENEVNNSVDKFYIRSLVTQELKVMRLQREEAAGLDIKSQDKKREYDVLNKLTSKLKASKDTRDNEGERGLLNEILDDIKEEGVGKEIEEYKEKQKKKEKYLEKSEKRRKEVGNEF